MGWFDWRKSEPEKVQRRKGRMRRNPARAKQNLTVVKRGSIRPSKRSDQEKRRRFEEWRREQGNG